MGQTYFLSPIQSPMKRIGSQDLSTSSPLILLPLALLSILGADICFNYLYIIKSFNAQWYLLLVIHTSIEWIATAEMLRDQAGFWKALLNIVLVSI
ncbi:hypothetical protein XENTR_v10020673 [Xenopus tropicalis]|nr:hypothetical protein XENTR_v10020673 [Xenopus tropicalis]